ncbi:MAG: Rrf2 family transcriptional regulator [Acidobacteriota bacterium]
MITKTTVSAVRTLIHLARQGPGGLLSPRKIAEDLNESPTYLAKVTRLLVKKGILRAERGVKGGVRLGRPPREITLLDILEACQGSIVGSYCEEDCELAITCAYHHAAVELREAVVGVLSRWTLEQLLQKPNPLPGRQSRIPCVLTSPSGLKGVTWPDWSPPAAT